MAEIKKRAEAEELVQLLRKLSPETRKRFAYMIEGAVLVTTAECPPAETA